jgi:Glycosyl hydrolase 36 superfamily, catalytic domain/Glycosyltransferase family 36
MMASRIAPALALLASALALPGSAAARPAPASAPAPLSADQTPADVASTFGSGSFGRWTVDGFGLPAYRYEVDEQVAVRARQPELNGATAAQHELGNDHIVAAAFNDGYTQLWSQDRLAQWANRYAPEQRHYAGGYGYLNVGGRVLSTLYLDRPHGAATQRRFGIGYYHRSLRAAGVEVREDVYAPFGNDPVLLHDVTIRNTTAHTRRMSWFEYWDVNPYDQTNHRPRGLGVPRWDAAAKTLMVDQRAGESGDNRPLSIFAAALQGPLGGHGTSVAAFFGSGNRAAPAAVAADRLRGTTAPPAATGAGGQTLFAFRAPLRLRAGESVTLRYVYGIAHRAQIAGLVRRYGRAHEPLAASEHAWARWLPKASFGAGNQWVARELQWDAYLLRAATVYDEACGHHTITQGGYYQYSSGENLGSRSWLHYLLPMVYADPATAREILRYSVSLQSQTAGDIPYGTVPLCKLYNGLGTSDDLDLWLLLGAAEYGLGSRDVAFFSERQPFYDSGRRVSVWEHLKVAFRHQESLRGPHGGYLAGTNGDWSDFSATFLHMSESMLVSAQLAYAYPRLAELADLRGDRAFAAQLRRRADQLLGVLRREWTGRWYLRGYSGSSPIGRGVIFGEPQPWAVLAGAPSPRQAGVLVRNIRRFLTGVGAPAALNGPAKIGSALSPAARDPGVTDPPTSGAFDGASQYVGGVWFDVNGWLTWALADLDGVVPGAAGYAWSEYTRNTLAAHAHAFPAHWDGTISIDDACNAFYARHPDRCGIVLYNDYEGQITEQPTWMVMNAVHLAGVTSTQHGFLIDPHLARFSLRLPRVGVARQPGLLRGYLRVARRERLVMQIHGVPGGARGVTTWANGLAVAHSSSGGYITFSLPARPDRAADWAVSWR